MVKEWKKKKVEELKNEIISSPVVGLIDMHSLPAKQLHLMRKALRGKVKIVMSRKSIIERALTGTKKEKLKEYLGKMPALIFTDLDPFKVAKLFDSIKAFAPAKAGDIAPYDLILPKGPSPFTPGPIISLFGKYKIKTKVENGKLSLLDDVVVVKEGEQVPSDIVDVLRAFGIEPTPIKLTITAIWENGNTYTADQIEIDEEEYKQKLISAHKDALTLAIELALPVKEVMGTLLSKAHLQAYNLAVSENIITSETKELILNRAEMQAKSLAKNLYTKDPNSLSKELGDEIVKSMLS